MSNMQQVRLQLKEIEKEVPSINGETPTIIKMGWNHVRFANLYDDEYISDAMHEVAGLLLKRTGALFCYIHSDTFILVLPPLLDNTFMGGKLQKLVSSLSSLATGWMYEYFINNPIDGVDVSAPTFSTKLIDISDIYDVVEYLIWINREASVKSIQHLASCHLHFDDVFEKPTDEVIDMLLDEGVDWESKPLFFKGGTFVGWDSTKIPHIYNVTNYIPFKELKNKRTTLFDRAEPIQRGGW